MESFYEALNIPAVGKYDYILFFVGKAKTLGTFNRIAIEEICKTVPFTGNYKKDFDDYFANVIMTKSYGTFMRTWYNGLIAYIRQINKDNGFHDTRTNRDLEKSHIQRTENMVYFTDLLKDFFSDLYGEEYVANPCFDLFYTYIVETRERLLISLDDFTFIDYFLKTFKKLDDLKFTEAEIDRQSSKFSLLGEDFIRVHNGFKIKN